jgi:toxin ParE1/3/4
MEAQPVKVEPTPDAAQWVEAELSAGRFAAAEEAVRYAIDRARQAELREMLDAAEAEGGSQQGGAPACPRPTRSPQSDTRSIVIAAPRLSHRGSPQPRQVAAYIARESKSRATADAFVDKLIEHCEHLATLPGLIGRPRPELRPNYRSTTFGSYVIFLRYSNEDGSRSHLYVVDVIHGSRDIEAHFAAEADDDSC